MTSITSITSNRSRTHRLWFLWWVAGVTVVAIAVIRLRPELERNLKSWATLVLSILALLLAFLWLVFLSGFRWRTRLVAAAAVVLALVGAKLLIRVDGTMDGTGIPKLVWRWSPHREDGIKGLALSPSSLPPSTIAAALDGVRDVPQFLGPNRDGSVRDPGLDHDWAAKAPRQLWRQPIGLGWSAFSVAGGRAFTQEQRGDEELVTCYDLPTGRLLWAHGNHRRFSQWQGGDGPRATPTVSDGRVFAYGATGMLDCLNADDGKPIWSHDVLEENHLANLTWGVSCSPLVFDDKVVVTGGQSQGPVLLAYRRETGVPIWKQGSGKALYASPLLAKVAGRDVIVSGNAGPLTLHDRATGAVLLEHTWTNENFPKAAQPTVIEGDRIFLSAGYNIGCVLLQISAGADGKLEAKELWRNHRMKAQFNSIVSRGGMLYGLDDGMLACMDAATGERRWKEGRYGSGQSLLVGDLMLIQAEPGFVALAEIKPDTCRELGRLNALSSKTWNYPTLAGRYLLVRNDQEAVCYELSVTWK